MKKTTVRIEDNLHRKIMKHCIDIDKSFQEYVIQLIKQDLNLTEKELPGQVSIDDYLK